MNRVLIPLKCNLIEIERNVNWIYYSQKSSSESKDIEKCDNDSDDAKWEVLRALLYIYCHVYKAVYVSRIIAQPNSFYWALLATLFIIRNDILFVNFFLLLLLLLGSSLPKRNVNRSGSSLTMLPFCLDSFVLLAHTALIFISHKYISTTILLLFFLSLLLFARNIPAFRIENAKQGEILKRIFTKLIHNTTAMSDIYLFGWVARYNCVYNIPYASRKWTRIGFEVEHLNVW